MLTCLNPEPRFTEFYYVNMDLVFIGIGVVRSGFEISIWWTRPLSGTVLESQNFSVHVCKGPIDYMTDRL